MGQLTTADESVLAEAFDGVDVGSLAARLRVPSVIAYHAVGSTLDVAHRLAQDGALAGTLVLADEQTAGRGRLGRLWRSNRGAGIWLTLIERPRDAQALGVLSLRVGLALAPALDAFGATTVSLKWPNDLYLADRKLGGILVEARWRDGALEWVAIGVGINVRAPEEEARAAGLLPTAERLAVLAAIVPAIRRAAAVTGGLRGDERAAFAARDLAPGRRCVEPVHGTVQGIDEGGALLVDTADGRVAARSGSLVLEEER